MKKPKQVKRVAVLYNDGSMNILGKRRISGKSPLETAVEECAGANENTKRKADRARVVYVVIDESSIVGVFP